MVLPTVFLIHTATINHATAETVDDYGSPVPGTTVSTTVSCRFVSPKETMRGSGGSVIIVSSPRILLPAGTAVSVNDTLTSTDVGYAETYKVNSVNMAYEAAQKIVSHISCDIAAVV